MIGGWEPARPPAAVALFGDHELVHRQRPVDRPSASAPPRQPSFHAGGGAAGRFAPVYAHRRREKSGKAAAGLPREVECSPANTATWHRRLGRGGAVRGAPGDRARCRRLVLTDPFVPPRLVVLLVVALGLIDGRKLARDLLPVGPVPAGHLIGAH